MSCLLLPLLAAATPVPSFPDQARRVVEWQLRSPPREGAAAGLSAEEAAAIRQLYLQSIGQRPPKPSDDDRRNGR